MARKKNDAPETGTAEPVSDTNGHANGNGQAPREVVKVFTALSGKDTTIKVEIVRSEFQTKDGKMTVLSAVASKIYVKQDGSEGTSYSYRSTDVPVLIVLLDRAHAFIVGQRVIEDVPFN